MAAPTQMQDPDNRPPSYNETQQQGPTAPQPPLVGYQPVGYGPPTQGYEHPPHGYGPPQGYSQPQPNYFPMQHPAPPTTTQNVTNSTTVVVANAAPCVTVPVYMPPNYAGWSWFTCLCCFFPIGIAAIIASNSVDNAIASGNYVAAAMYSRRAKRLNVSAIVFSLTAGALTVLAFVIVGRSSSGQDSYNSNNY